MMTPLFCCRMIGITCLAARMQPFKLIATQRSNASSVIASSSASPPARLTPTLLCRMSMRPQRLIASAAIASICALLVTSAPKTAAVPPFAAIMSTVSSAEARLRSTHRTAAPSRAKVSAVARPLPMPSPGLCPAPTTMATRSFRRMVFHPLKYGFLLLAAHVSNAFALREERNPAPAKSTGRDHKFKHHLFFGAVGRPCSLRHRHMEPCLMRRVLLSPCGEARDESLRSARSGRSRREDHPDRFHRDHAGDCAADDRRDPRVRLLLSPVESARILSARFRP